MSTTERLHIAGRADLIHTVPALLGMNPVESLVLVGVSEAAVSGTLRIDLGAIGLPGVLPGVFAAIRRSFATGVIAIVYSQTTARTELLAEPIAECAAWAGLELLAALRATAHGMDPLTGPRPRPRGAPHLT